MIPQEAAVLILGLTSNRILILLLIFCVYLFAGMLLDLGASIIILVPVLWPVTQSLGIDPIQFGIVTVVGLAIGLVTPPVGASLVRDLRDCAVQPGSREYCGAAVRGGADSDCDRDHFVSGDCDVAAVADGVSWFGGVLAWASYSGVIIGCLDAGRGFEPLTFRL